MLDYWNLENYIKQVIISCIDSQGYIEGGHLRCTVDSCLATEFSKMEFLPCEIENGILKVYYKEKDVPEGIQVYGYQCKYFIIQRIIEEYLTGDIYKL